MSSVSKLMIESNYKANIFNLSVQGVDGVVFVKQSPSECRSGRVSIYCKVGKEKANKIGVYSDNFSIESLKDYIAVELIEQEFIVD
jgi:pyruvate formate-lyase activating enzyme-like uncharacterized protein